MFSGHPINYTTLADTTKISEPALRSSSQGNQRIIFVGSNEELYLPYLVWPVADTDQIVKGVYRFPV